MDPFSIATGCVALFDAAWKTTERILVFAQYFQDALPDLFAICVRLEQLRQVLRLLHDGSGAAAGTSDADDRIKDQINHGMDVMDELGSLVGSCDMSPAKWALRGKSAAENAERKLGECVDRLQWAVGPRAW